jgi:hypothetical protein
MSRDLHLGRFSGKKTRVLNEILVFFDIRAATKHPIVSKAHGSDSRARRALERGRVQLLVGLALSRRHYGHDAVELRGGQRPAGTAPPRRDLRGGERWPRVVAAQARALCTRRQVCRCFAERDKTGELDKRAGGDTRGELATLAPSSCVRCRAL